MKFHTKRIIIRPQNGIIMSRDNNMYHDEEGGHAVDSDDEPEFWDRGGGFEIEVGEDEGEGDEDNVDDNYDVQEGNVHIDKIGIGEVLMPSDLGYIHNKRILIPRYEEVDRLAGLEFGVQLEEINLIVGKEGLYSTEESSVEYKPSLPTIRFISSS